MLCVSAQNVQSSCTYLLALEISRQFTFVVELASQHKTDQQAVTLPARTPLALFQDSLDPLFDGRCHTPSTHEVGKKRLHVGTRLAVQFFGPRQKSASHHALLCFWVCPSPKVQRLSSGQEEKEPAGQEGHRPTIARK